MASGDGGPPRTPSVLRCATPCASRGSTSRAWSQGSAAFASARSAAAPSWTSRNSFPGDRRIVAERQLGVIAAGHQLTVEAGADVLRDGGNAVDAALAAMLTDRKSVV